MALTGGLLDRGHPRVVLPAKSHGSPSRRRFRDVESNADDGTQPSLASRPLPVGYLRPPLIWNHEELHGPAVAGCPQNASSARVGLERNRLRQYRNGVSRRVRGGHGGERLGGGSSRHAAGLCARDGLLEFGFHGSCSLSQLWKLPVGWSALGFGEAGVFPASIRTVAEWFPKKERALATGIFNAGTTVGASITPMMAPWIVTHWGWRWAFVFTGALGGVWLVFWLIIYRKPDEHPKVSRAELEYIRRDPQTPIMKMKWSTLLPHRQTWAFVMGKFLTDPIWWFYLFWVPDFLQRRHGLPLTDYRATHRGDLSDF